MAARGVPGGFGDVVFNTDERGVRAGGGGPRAAGRGRGHLPVPRASREGTWEFEVEVFEVFVLMSQAAAAAVAVAVAVAVACVSRKMAMYGLRKFLFVDSELSMRIRFQKKYVSRIQVMPRSARIHIISRRFLVFFFASCEIREEVIRIRYFEMRILLKLSGLNWLLTGT